MAQILLTAQNIDIYDGDGLDLFARTGATSVEQVHKAGAEGVILGHSEVGDSPETVAQKLQTIIARSSSTPHFLHKLTVLVGETWEEFEKASPQEIGAHVRNHLALILEEVPENYLKEMVVGYEPKWGSRGSGRDDMPPPASEIISQVCKSLREWLTDSFSDAGSSIPLIYGGRSTPERTEQILGDANVAGLILGSACNSVAKTMEIAKAMARVKPAERKVLHANFKAYNLADSYEAYLKELRTLDDTFIVYLSPCHSDLREVKALL